MNQVSSRKRGRRSSRGKKERRKRVAKALAAAGAIAGGTQAYAAPVRFENPPGAGHFVWPSAGSSAVQAQWLDLTQDAASQPPIGDPVGATSIRQIPSFIGYTDGPYVEPQVEGLFAYPFDLLGVDAGTMIPTPGAAWAVGYSAYLSYPGYESAIPDGATTYLGVRFNGPGYQYAWIKVERSGDSLDALAWGYETDPGVPIAAGAGGGGGDPIPTVSEYGLMGMGLGVLAAGAWVARKRRAQVESEPA